MAGATLALALSSLTQGKLTIDVVEAKLPTSMEHPGYDARAIALAEGTIRQLSRVGLWSSLSEYGTTITQIHVSDTGHAGFVSMDASEYQLDALGYVVELHPIGQKLYSLLRQAKGVNLHCPDTVIQVSRTQENVTVHLSSGKMLEAHLLVAADGAMSFVGQQCGITWSSEEYHQVAVITNVMTKEPHNGRAFERFTASGPLAMLPMSDGRSSLVWCHHTEKQLLVDGWDDKTFLSELQKAFGWRLGEITQVGQRSSYPLRLMKASSHINHRVALVGNASQLLHPIAGQGFNLGMRDVMSLAETIATALTNSEDVGSHLVLSRYQQRRLPDRDSTIALTDGLIHLFANDYMPLVAGRNLGLMAMDCFSSLRENLTRRTLGWVER